MGNRYQFINKQGYTSTYTHNTVNQYTHLHTDYILDTTADADISHDDNGNLSLDAAGYEYAYDHRNRLTEITDTAKFGHDALGRRISKYDEAADTTTYYYYNAFDQVTAEYEEPTAQSAELARTFVYGNGIDEVLAMYLPERDYDPDDVDKLMDFCDTWLADSSDGNYNSDYDYDDSGVVDFNDFAVLANDSWSLPETKETRFYYLHDALGSVIGIVGGKFQREADREFYLYNVYGKSAAVSEVGNPYLFTARRLDILDGGSLKIYHYRTRTYNPQTGRFLQTDPIGYYDSMSLYEYVGSNPANWVDPSGLLYGMMYPGGKSLSLGNGSIDPVTKKVAETAGTVVMVPVVLKAQLDCLVGAVCDFLADPKGNTDALLNSLGDFSEVVIERNVHIYINVKESNRPWKTFASEEIRWGKDLWAPVGISALEGYCDQIDRAAGDDFWESCKARAEITIVITELYYAGKGALKAGKQIINNADNIADDIVINTRGRGCKVEVTQITNAADDPMTFYRGDRAGTTVIKSRAAQEKGYEFADQLLKSGDREDLMRAHSLSNTKGGSPLLSVTTDPRVARYHAGPEGIVNKLRIPRNRVSPNNFYNISVLGGPRDSLIPESEWYIPNYIRPSEIVK